MCNTIQSYQNKKMSGHFFDYRTELQYITNIIDRITPIMISFDNPVGSPSYRAAHELYRFFCPLYDELDLRHRKEQRLQQQYAQRSKSMKKSWADNPTLRD